MSMSRANDHDMTIGCPECETTVPASVPPGPGICAESTADRLQGNETSCRNCGHEFEIYFY